MANSNEYMRQYMLRRYHTRRAKAIEYLGSKCTSCESTVALEIDHIDPSSKSLDLGRCYSYSEAIFWAEIQKCQLLCKKCHIEKTIVERGHKVARGTHGTLSSYRYCKCDKCKAAKAQYTREYRRPSRRKST